MEVIVTIIWLTVTQTLYGVDQMLCRRRLDESDAEVARLLDRPAMFLNYEEFTVGPFRRPVSTIVLSLILFQIGLLICGVVLLVGVAQLYALLTGNSVWDEPEGFGLKLLMGAFLLLGVACLPIAVVMARRTLRGGQVTLRRDGTLLEWKSDKVFCPWEVWHSINDGEADRSSTGRRWSFEVPSELLSQMISESAGVPLAHVPSSSVEVEPHVLTVDHDGRASLADVFEVRASEIVTVLRQIAARLT